MKFTDSHNQVVASYAMTIVLIVNNTLVNHVLMPYVLCLITFNDICESIK